MVSNVDFLFVKRKKLTLFAFLRFRYPFGLSQNVVIPLMIEGGLLDAMSAFGNFLAIFMYDFLIQWFASLDWITQPFDFQRTSDAWVAFWPLWQNVICYLCDDLCVFFKLQPVVVWPSPSIIPVFWPPSLLGSNQLGDPQFVCAIFNIFNGFMRLIQPMFAIILSLLIGQTPLRPDFRSAFQFFCDGVSCLVRSVENAAQFFVDEFLPFPFVFNNFFCWADTAVCLLLKLIDNLLRMLINIDQVVQYNNNTNKYYLQVTKRDIVEWLNLAAPLNFVAPNPDDMIDGTPYPFLWPSTEMAVDAPDGTRIVNPQYGKLTLAECLSLFFERLICDPANNSTACFDPGAQSILGPFDPGCLFYQATVTAADIVAGFAELSYHLYNDMEFFTFVDRQFTTTIWKEDLTDLVKCVFDAFAIIPTMGPCLSRFFTGNVQLLLCILDFLIRFLSCLIFLAYYIINDIPCFITEKGRAQVFIRALLDEFANVDNPDSVVNCLCFMLNYGIQVPPIPCSTCIAGGWIQPSPPTRRKGAPIMPQDLDEGHSVMDDATPVPGLDYWPLHDHRWVQHTRGKRAGHRPQVQSVLKELRLERSEKRSFYDSFVHNTKHFENHVSIKDMTQFFAQRRERFQRKLDNYLRPWRDERAMFLLRQRYQQKYQQTSPNPGHPSNWDKPWLGILKEGREAQYARHQRVTPMGNDPFFSVKQDADAAHLWDDDRDPPARLSGQEGPKPKQVITPTDPPIMGCTPTPACFDTCDMFRSAIVFIDKFVILVTDALFSLLQDWDIAFPYYVTGDVSICSELCPTVDKNAPDCEVACPGINISFEEDLRVAIVALADMLRAICNLINLVVPVELTINGVPIIEERPDLCCSVVRLGDLVACILLVIIKAIKALALEGGQGFPYFTQGLFLMDVDMLFDLTFDVVVCVCNIVRTVFPVQSVADLDLCCIVQNGAMAILETAQWAFQIVISLGTIQSSGNAYFVDPNCNWTDSGCDPNVDNIGFVVQGDIVSDSIFGALGGACSTSGATAVDIYGCGTFHGKDQGVGGVITCVCQLVTTIFPVRPNPGEPTSPTNCPIVDMCCVLRRAGFAANALLKFAIRLLASMWQRWEGNPPLPQGFISFWFCNENTAPPDSPCGEFNPIIDSLVSLVDECLCEFFGLVDAFFKNAWPTFSCFCGRYDGIFCGIGGLVRVLLIQVVELFRRLNDPLYWQPRYGDPSVSMTGNVPVGTEEYPINMGSINLPPTLAKNSTWAFRFFAPIAIEACKFAASIVCFIQVIVPRCTVTRAIIVESIVIWAFEIVIRLIEFIEGFVLTFAGKNCGGSSSQTNGFGFDTKCLTGAMVSLLSLPVDLLIADAAVVCGGSPCGCWGAGYELSDANFAQITNNKCVLRGGYIDQIDDSREGYTDCLVTFDDNGNPLCRPRCEITSGSERCVDIPLPVCYDRLGAAIPIDGIIMALLKYFRCMLAVIFPFFDRVNPADGILLVVSIFWQLSRAIINFIAAFIVFFFVLFTIGAGIGGCKCHNGTLAVQRGGLCYNCRDPDIGKQVMVGPLLIWTELVDATPDLSDVIVPADGLFMENQCCRKSNYSSIPGSEYCQVRAGADRSDKPLVVCSGLNLVGAFFNLLSAFVGIFTAFSRIVTPDYTQVITEVRNRAHGPTVHGPMTREQTEAYERYREAAQKNYHKLRSRYNGTSGEDPVRFVFHRWIRGSRDPHSRSRHHFKKRAEATMTKASYMSAGLYEHGMAKGEDAGEVPMVLMDALFGYDTDDCMDDPISCLCRNFDIPEMCTWDPEYDEPMANHTLTTKDVMHAVMAAFENHTVCDSIIRDADEIPWIDVPFAIRSQYMDCVEKRIQGERIRDMYPGFPPDMFYSFKDGMPELILNLHQDWNYMYTEDVKQREEQSKRYFEKHVRGTRFERFQDELDKRSLAFQKIIDNSQTSFQKNAFRFLERLDRFDYKLTQGYYHHYGGKQLEQLKLGRQLQPVSMLRRIQVASDHVFVGGALGIHALSRSTELPRIWWESAVNTVRVAQDMYERGVPTVMGEAWQRYKDALASDNASREPPPKAYVEKQAMMRRAILESPFYKWLFGTNETKRSDEGPSILHKRILGPFERFRRHLSAVFEYQRHLAYNGTLNQKTGKRVKQDNVFNLWGARRQWEALKDAFWKRWEPRPLTQRQRENRAKAWRVLHKIRYMWDPHSVRREDYERFIVNCNCAVVDGALALLVDVVNYCANSFVPNTPMLKRIASDVLFRSKIFGGMWSQRVHEAANFTLKQGPLSRFVERIEPMVRDTNYTFHMTSHHMRGKSTRAQYQWHAWPIAKSDSEFYYIRPRIVTPENPRPLHRDLSKIDPKQWRRNQNSNGAAGFNLVTWFLCLIDSIFDSNFANDLDQWFMDLETWFNNPR